jgi:hypothetical protein
VPAPTAAAIRALVRAGRYTLSLHAEHERQAERITMAELETALCHAEVIEEYPHDPRGPSCLIVGFAEQRPIHAVCALKPQPREILLITVYDPSLRAERWSADFRQRRRT